MALKLRIKSLEDVPAEQRPLYREAREEERKYGEKIAFEEKFILDVDGAVDKARLDEMRNNNIAVSQERDTLKTKAAEIEARVAAYGEITPEQAKEFAAKAKNAGKTGEEFDKAVKDATEAARADFEEQARVKDAAIAERDKQLQTLTGTVHNMKIEGTFRDLAGKMHVVPTAVDDLLSRATRTFKLEGDNLVGYGPDGGKLYGADAKPLTAEEWMKAQTKAAPHLFDASKGGGAGGGEGGSGDIPKVSQTDAGNHLEAIAEGKMKVG